MKIGNGAMNVPFGLLNAISFGQAFFTVKIVTIQYFLTLPLQIVMKFKQSRLKLRLSINKFSANETSEMRRAIKCEQLWIFTDGV